MLAMNKKKKKKKKTKKQDRDLTFLSLWFFGVP
jgi:hypothetical protein